MNEYRGIVYQRGGGIGIACKQVLPELLREKLPLSAEVLWDRCIIFHLNRQEEDLLTQEVIYIHSVLCFTKCLPEKFRLTVIHL